MKGRFAPNQQDIFILVTCDKGFYHITSHHNKKKIYCTDGGYRPAKRSKRELGGSFT